MIKLFGASIIFIFSTAWGYISSQIPYKRYKNLLKIISCLNTMKNEIRFSQDYIDDILLKVSKICEFDFIFKTTTTFDKTIPISKRWKQALTYDAPSLKLSTQDCEALIGFGAELGMTDKEGQLKNIENTVSILNTLQVSAKDEYEKMSKLKKGLGLSLGLFTIILLY